MLNKLVHYQRNLPHRLPPGETLFVTFRLADSLPLEILEQLRATFETANETEDEEEKCARQRRYFGRFDRYLDGATTGPLWLRQPALARRRVNVPGWTGGTVNVIINEQMGAALPNARHPPRCRAEVSRIFFYVVQGRASYMPAPQWYPVPKGEAICMAPFCQQWAASIGKEPSVHIYYKDVDRLPTVI